MSPEFRISVQIELPETSDVGDVVKRTFEIPGAVVHRIDIQSSKPFGDIGIIVREARISLGLSQNDLAVKVGLSRASISLLETGSRSISTKAMKKVVGGLELDEEDTRTSTLMAASLQTIPRRKK